MNAPVRKPLFTAARPTRAASIYTDNPSEHLVRHYRQVWQSGMQGMPFLNPHLDVAAIGFQQYRGDWVGAVITPWFLNLFILPGGGELWRDHASGDRVRISFPVGELEFIADLDPGSTLEACLYCPLVAPVNQFPDQQSAQDAAEAALQALLSPPPTAAPDAAEKGPQHAANPPPARRAFFKRLTGLSQG